MLNPALTSRGAVSQAARERVESEAFTREMTALFRGEPGGRLALPTLADLVERVERLEATLKREGLL